jgi:PEGA domain
MFIHSPHRSGSTGMKRFPFLICLAILLLIVQVGIASADSPITTHGMTGGSVYFETNPPGATIWLDNVELGTSPFTYYFEKPGTFDVIVRKKWYEDYTDKVVVIAGERVVFYARLTPVPSDMTVDTTPAAPVTTATTISTSTIKIPTPWPTTSPQSPLDPAVVIGAAAVGIGFFVIRRR